MFRRLNLEREPWTSDPILSAYKFTNAYRAADRVSQFLIRNVIYNGDSSSSETLFRILVFRSFNSIRTWEHLCGIFGDVTYKEFDFEEYDSVLTNLRSEGQSIYSPAYIMPSGKSSFGFANKHQNHLSLIQLMMRDRLDEKLSEIEKMSDGFELIKSYPMMGDFLAYQLLIDINYSELTSFSENEFVVPGPGARSGIRKCFTDTAGLSNSDIIRIVTDRQEEQFEVRELTFPTLWGRRLHLIDCQNIFCEIDKYARVHHPEFNDASGRSRIKQKFTSSQLELQYWFPPKWGLNDTI